MSADDSQPIGPSVMLILTDNLSTGELEVACFQRPSEHKPGSPAHTVGKWLNDNLSEIIETARASAAANRPDVGQSIIGPDRERTIVVPGDN